MSEVLFPCSGCGVDQAIATTAVEITATVTGRALAHCVCPDCGTGTMLRVSRRMASEIDYWKARDRVEAAQERAYARAEGLHPSAVPGACRDVVEGCERLLREVAE